MSNDLARALMGAVNNWCGEVAEKPVDRRGAYELALTECADEIAALLRKHAEYEAEERELLDRQFGGSSKP